MKKIHLLLALLFSVPAFAQTRASLAHGTIFGSKPDTTGVMAASKVEGFMDNKARISVSIRGKVTKVTKSKGGWFEMDAGNGRTIRAHFKNYGVNIPASLAGHTVVLDGIAAKQFIADDGQHFAGDTVNGKKQHKVNTNPKRRLTFEVKGMMVE
ncbi:MAG TPA: DUF4920 domain-containing protein [Mucilaginibacter sp.]|nr:DUF4920 domain-containing protein [Mucilaginibacter sp.]